MEVDEPYVRSKEEIEEVIKLGNIDGSDLKPLTQVLLPCSPRHSEKYKLIELDNNLLSELTEGTCLSFRGHKDDNVVLCTKERTYQIKEAETSNTLILVPNVKMGKEISSNSNNSEDRTVEFLKVEGQFHTYYELLETKPKLEGLLTLLQPSAYEGPEYEKQLNPDTFYTWEKLQSEVQASDAELKEALTNNLIANMNGYFRLISFDYEARALPLMLDFLDENSWEIDEIDKEATYENLKELIPREAFDLIFDKYTEPSEKKNKKGETLYRYNEEKTCKFLAQVLLAASPVNDYDHFMESWKIGVPEKLKPKDRYLSGIALIIWNPKKMKKEVVSFPESKLSENIVKRLNELFKVKDKWTVDEITPYISRCTTRTADVNALLTKYARPSTVNGIKYYSSKHGK